MWVEARGEHVGRFCFSRLTLSMAKAAVSGRLAAGPCLRRRAMAALQSLGVGPASECLVGVGKAVAAVSGRVLVGPERRLKRLEHWLELRHPDRLVMSRTTREISVIDARFAITLCSVKSIRSLANTDR